MGLKDDNGSTGPLWGPKPQWGQGEYKAIRNPEGAWGSQGGLRTTKGPWSLGTTMGPRNPNGFQDHNGAWEP